jgi:hydrogenase nickel incorporation protein HypA/HybF
MGASDMHESSLARRLVELCLQQSGGKRVHALRGTIAETEQLSHEALALHFAAHARGSVAEGARLELALVHVRARCRACGALYAPVHHLLLCPGCGSTDGEQLGETGLRIDSIEVELGAESDPARGR